MTAFGLGELPGTDLVTAADVVLSESPLPHIPQLPERGIGSDLIGRTAALLDIPIDRGPRGWRVGTQHRAVRDQMDRDLDVLESLWAGKLDAIKVQVVGPWTLAAEIEMRNGHRMITDTGALRDVTEALAQAIDDHREDVGCRLAPTVLQIDEPSLDAVMRGSLHGATDAERIPAYPEPEERLAGFGKYLLHAPMMINVPWQTVDLADLQSTAEKDRFAQLLDRGSRFALAPMRPRDVWNVLDELQTDPEACSFDVWARPADTLKQAAANYREAAEMTEGLR